jgi:hypothetical protein
VLQLVWPRSTGGTKKNNFGVPSIGPRIHAREPSHSNKDLREAYFFQRPTNMGGHVGLAEGKEGQAVGSNAGAPANSHQEFTTNAVIVKLPLLELLVSKHCICGCGFPC